ncbi:formamidopyrimidine-DNA glycosylase [Longilinea arvoryzae]|uniref:Formamidopyrimidine-DNA glycosylase n=1 Tax=Longilinea arvoryzae TaxID=360412 RepID=A0A0S7BCW3_9CHLR|nr:DNA-formamidopyrimidine glycosylase family protein [Longilinea arvoryzae]GAP12624.1 formamidopyrimidine-DNA glycosylase [Longilinea arvoryzae]
MLEIPEAAVLARQINQSISGKTIHEVVAAQSPHKFAWYTGDPAGYAGLLTGKTIGAAAARGGMLEIEVEDHVLVFSDGVNLRFHHNPAERPAKHQLLMDFSDGTALSASVAMYGGLMCFARGTEDNAYYRVACEKPSPLRGDFTPEYFGGLFQPELDKLSVKAFLATEQRIPGLGNGVLQDILYNAKLHPKRKVNTLSASEREGLLDAIVTTLHEMTDGGGRDTERDLFGNPGGYATKVSKNTVGLPCPECGSTILKEAYMGGSIYYCPGCQKG